MAAARHLGQHPNWAYTWRKRRATGGFALTARPGHGRKPAFPLQAVALVKALACELPTQRDRPLSRYSTADLTRLIAAHPDAPPMSASTIWRILASDALKPWQHQHWPYPRDPRFAEKAGCVLDLYAGWWEGQPLSPDACLISADEQTSIQARVRCHTTPPPRPGQAMRVEHEYGRGGAGAYLVAWDVRRGGVIGRCDAMTGIVAFGKLVDAVMQREPYRAAPRVFWVVDNGSSQRGDAACQRLQARYPNLILVHLPPTPPGSTSSSASSRSSSARRSRPTTSPTSPLSSNASWTSRRATMRARTPASNARSTPPSSPLS